jgi:hypothetical protein
MKANMMRVAARILIAAGVAGSIAAAQAQATRDLTLLTAPADRLSPGCRLKTVPSKTETPPGIQRVVLPARDPVLVPANPWIGDDRRLAAAIRHQVDGFPRVVDGPPLDAAGSKAFAVRWADHVVEAYGATYLADDDSSIHVYAVRFDDATRATPAPPDGTTLVSRGPSTRVVLGPAVVRVMSRTRSSCFDAISDYVQSLR